jgi:hypothetical protein
VLLIGPDRGGGAVPLAREGGTLPPVAAFIEEPVDTEKILTIDELEKAARRGLHS